ncbi:MAG: hypothetical protein SO170_09720 [Butyribacter sp.]|nr:hypothetical protein [bacterium]MDY3855212.1 hypothetical protein [Butyribacter sp.]
MFGREKKQQEFELEEKYVNALKQLTVPILTLDPKWHQLFPDYLKTKRLKKLEKKLNKLIKKQGQTNNDLKEYEKARKVIMENILNNMTDGSDIDSPIRNKKQDKNQELLEELQDKIEQANQVIDKIPVEIKMANQELLIESMRICYETLITNTERIEAEEEWIGKAREILKEHILVKQEMEIRNTETYKYMHDLLGAKVLEVFDKDQKIWKGEISNEHSDAETKK